MMADTRIVPQASTQPERLVQFVVMALNRGDGSVLWQKTMREQAPLSGTHADGSWASGSPITDGELLYAYLAPTGSMP